MINLLTHFNNQQTKFPEYIYHYTSMSSFQKIIETKKLLLFNSMHMNDYMENYYIIKCLKDLILKDDSLLNKNQKNIFFEQLNHLRRFNEVTPYIFSMTELGDSLSQWRSYGDDGYGICLQFDSKMFDIQYSLSSVNESHEKSMMLHNVIYDIDEQLNIFKSIIESSKFAFMGKDVKSDQILMDYIFNFINRFKSLFKSQEFFEEKEWRIVYTPLIMGNDKSETFTQDGRKDIGFIIERNNIKSYFPLLLRNDLRKILRHVTVGSKNITSDFEMKAFLDTHGFNETTNSKTNITYR